MSWQAAAGQAGAEIIGGLIGAYGAKKASKAQKKALDKQLALQNQMYYANLGINEPWRATGQGALNNLAKLFGLPYQGYQPATSIASQYDVGEGPGVKFNARTVIKMMNKGMSIEEISKLGRLQDKAKTVNYLAQRGFSPEDIAILQGGPTQQLANAQGGTGGLTTPSGPDMSVFTQSPGYQFRRDEGQRDIGNSFAARGGAFSGNSLRALTDFNQNLASNEFGNFYNQMANLAGMGQVATNNAGQYGQNYANQAGNTLANQGNARASGIANQYNMIGQGIGGAANAFGNWWDQRNQPQNNYYNPYGRGA